jgi:hypothetical protein
MTPNELTGSGVRQKNNRISIGSSFLMISMSCAIDSGAEYDLTKLSDRRSYGNPTGRMRLLLGKIARE